MSVFSKMYSSEYKKDPIMGSDRFEMYGNPATFNSPCLFYVDEYKYVLINPKDITSNQELSFKIATYLYHHKTSYKNLPITYFFGDINKCKEEGDSFTNQITKYVSYEMIEEWYPKNILEIDDYIINFFLSEQRYYGQQFQLYDYDLCLLFFIPNYLEKVEYRQNEKYILTHLFEENRYLKQIQAYDDNIVFVITELAIEKFQKTQEKTNSKQAFIAIKFENNEKRIQTIQSAISECGFTPCDMTEYQTNNWIMPEIFHQIQLSKFVVVDLSLRCDGAYYEAGYAHALGKEVIHLYDERERENNPLHFDVAQKSTVMYNNLEEMKDKLIRRIKATIM